MSGIDRRKYLEAVDQIERDQGTDAPLTPKAILELLKFRFPGVWTAVAEHFADEHGLQLIALRQGAAIRSRRTQPEQLRLGLPGVGEIRFAPRIHVPIVHKKGNQFEFSKKGHWAKPLQAPLSDVELYLRREDQRLKTKSAREKENHKLKWKLFNTAVIAAKGDKSVIFGGALAKLKGKRKIVGLAETMSLFEK